MSSAVNIVIGVVILALVLYRQLRKRTVRADSRPAVLLILLVLGVFELGTFGKTHSLSGIALTMLAVSLVIAAGFGVLRAYTVKLWREEGTLWRQGTYVTAALWLVAIGVHFGVDLLIEKENPVPGLASAALLLYIAVSFGVQRLVVRARANRLDAAAAAGPRA
ncbi:MAG TPA: hypothetical protein VG756_09480 [Pseudonocardiaceae bacterium]|jgi:hypothetical protein|nr:hypothetical protein [Pseudonocardiaceae bacterium]